MEINELLKIAHKQSAEKGFWDEKLNIGEKLMLMVSEATEALEADRSNHYATETAALAAYEIEDDEDFKKVYKQTVKDTFQNELADLIIRAADLAGFIGVDMDSHLKATLRYNKLRPHKHNKAY